MLCTFNLKLQLSYAIYLHASADFSSLKNYKKTINLDLKALLTEASAIFDSSEYKQASPNMNRTLNAIAGLESCLTMQCFVSRPRIINEREETAS